MSSGKTGAVIEQVAELWKSVPFLVAVGVTTAVASAVPARVMDRWAEQSPLRSWAGVVLGVVFFATILAPAVLKKTPIGIAVIVSVIPSLVGTTAIRLANPNPGWAEPLRAAGVVLMLSVTLGGALWHARKYRELERLVFTEATSIAFFVTLIATGAYGVIQYYLELPRLSLLWVPLFGVVSWGLSVTVFRRRFS